MNQMDLLTGYVGISSFNGVTSPDYRVFQLFNPEKDYPQYLLRILQNCYHKRLFFPYGQGAAHLGRWRLPKEAFDNFLFPRPAYIEQVKIAEFLDYETGRIDALIGEQERLIELLKEKRQAVISHAVTKGLDPNAPLKDSGIDWLGQIPAHWTACRITHHLQSIIDYRGRTPEKVDDGIFLVTAKNIKDGKIDYQISQEYITKSAYLQVLQRGCPQVGDVVFTTEAPLGQVANLDRNDIALAQRVIKFSGKSEIVDNYFLKYWIMSNICQSELQSHATGSTALGIKGSKVLSTGQKRERTAESETVSRRGIQQQVPKLI